MEFYGQKLENGVPSLTLWNGWVVCVVAENFWSYSSSSGWTRGVMDREIRWLLLLLLKLAESAPKWWK